MSTHGASTSPAVVLIVDDDVAVRSTCERFLSRIGYRIRTASAKEEALLLLEEGGIDIVVTDLQMPGGSGLDLLKEIQSRVPDVPTILMSGRAEVEDAALALERGVVRLLIKPFLMSELSSSVQIALEQRGEREQVGRDRVSLADMVQQREAESRTWILRAAHALAAAVEAKDAYTAGHASRVTAYGMTLAEAVGGIDLPSFRLGGDLHDVGKIGVPDLVLNKPDRLTDQEFSLVRQHPSAGVQILKPLIDDPVVIGMIRSHHERWDGRGYPDGLAENEIPLPARILAVADTLDAMTSIRAYRAGLPWETAVSEITRCAGTQFDPKIVDIFTSRLEDLESTYRSFSS
jgi:response regulator RpfG family c-di-GMP phosphodiesterase